MQEDKLSIVVVEDNHYDRHLIRECLEDADMEVDLVELEDGESAIQFFQQSSGKDFDIVLLDIKLPRKSGYQVLSAIRERHGISSKPVIIMTAFEPPVPVVRQKHQADIFWNKPDDLQEFYQLSTIIKNLLQKRPTHG